MAKSPTPDTTALGVRERMLLISVGGGTPIGNGLALRVTRLRHWW
jgi:hypothetical protein